MRRLEAEFRSAGLDDVNLAVQDAVAAAFAFARPLQRRDLTTRNLAAVRRRR